MINPVCNHRPQETIALQSPDQYSQDNVEDTAQHCHTQERAAVPTADSGCCTEDTVLATEEVRVEPEMCSGL